MSRRISDIDIYAHAERLFSDKEVSAYRYCLAYRGNYVLCTLSADEVREIIACLQHALDATGKGGAQ